MGPRRRRSHTAAGGGNDEQGLITLSRWWIEMPAAAPCRAHVKRRWWAPRAAAWRGLLALVRRVPSTAAPDPPLEPRPGTGKVGVHSSHKVAPGMEPATGGLPGGGLPMELLQAALDVPEVRFPRCLNLHPVVSNLQKGLGT